MTGLSLFTDLGDGLHLGQASPDEITEAKLFPGELESLGAGAREPRVRSFKLGRLAARRALAGLGLESSSVPRGPAGEPMWPLGVVGSISHTNRVAISLVASDEAYRLIGVDVEEMTTFPGLAATVAFDGEAARLAELDEDERSHAILELFSAKESVYKAFRPVVGRFFGYEAVRVETTGPGSLLARFVEDLPGIEPGKTTAPIHVEWFDDLVATAVVLDG